MMTSYSKFPSQRMTLMSTTTTILIYWYNRWYDHLCFFSLPHLFFCSTKLEHQGATGGDTNR